MFSKIPHVVLLNSLPVAPTTVDEALEQFQNRWTKRLMTREAWSQVKGEVAQIAKRFEEDHYFLRRDPFDPGVLRVWVGEMTAEVFEAFLGRKPVDDDLHRVNCLKVGQVGHFMCGWCHDHGNPRYECGCPVPDGVEGVKASGTPAARTSSEDGEVS